jgi:hypothetical protein
LDVCSAIRQMRWENHRILRALCPGATRSGFIRLPRDVGGVMLNKSAPFIADEDIGTGEVRNA